MSNNAMQTIGRVTKEGSQFLKTLKDATDAAEHPKHPRHHGMKMQAHHAISEKGVDLSGQGDRLVEFGYDINVVKNLVFIPSTLQGACLLQVQPHRGNHTAVKSRDDDDSDDKDHHPAYHDMVKENVEMLVRLLESECGKPNADMEKLTQEKLDKLSAKIINNIQYNPKAAKLTAVWNHYQPGDRRGCKGVDSISSKKEEIDAECPKGRKHTSNNQGPKQLAENITYILEHPYQLKAGH